MKYLLLIFFVLMLSGSVYASPDWIQIHATNTILTTDCGNTYIFANGSGNGHLSDMYHNGSWYGGMPGQAHSYRGYTYYEAYYIDPDGVSRTSCVHIGANVKKIVYADNEVAVIECGCIGSTHVETWRYIIPRGQCGIYEMERKDLKRYFEAQNNQQVQFLNTSVLKTQFSDSSGGVTNQIWYIQLFSQFSKNNMPFEWANGYDSGNNVSLAWIHTGSDPIGRSIHRRYPSTSGLTEQQVDFYGAGEGTRTEMPLGKSWIETWKGIVPGDSYAVRAKALSLVGHTVTENKIPFISVTRTGSYLEANTGSVIYQHQPSLNYDVPYGSGKRMLTEYPYINGIRADKGSSLSSGEDNWNSSYRNPDESSAWLEYTIGNTSTGIYRIRNERQAYLDADGLVWKMNITAQTSGYMNFSVKYGLPSYSQSRIVDNDTFSMKTVDPIEGEYGLTFIFPEHLNTASSGLITTLNLEPRIMSAGETVSYKIYVIPHKWSRPVSIDSFHTHEKTTMNVPYRVLISGIEWMPTDTVTAYDALDTGNSYEIKAYSEEGKHTVQMYSGKKISSMTADVGNIQYSQRDDGTIFAEWDIPYATVGTISLMYADSGPTVDFVANVSEGYAPLIVQFNDTSIGNPISWNWDVTNDGSYEYDQQNITHIYTDVIGNSVKSFGVKLNVTNASGWNYKIKPNFIKIYPLNVSFKSSTADTSFPILVKFNDLTNNGTPSTWNWSFGDGTFSEVQNPSHAYNSAGTYNIQLNASNPYSYGIYAHSESFIPSSAGIVIIFHSP